MKNNKLPSYQIPPVNEVVCGMRFRPVDKLLIPHIGLLWEKFRTDYPNLQHAHPIVTNKGEILLDSATNLPIPRVWFINESDDHLIQFQKDRVFFNWRKRESDYPRYKHVIGKFENVYSNIKKLFEEFDLGELEPLEYELTYVNHIPIGSGWETTDDLSGVFSDFNWQKSTTRFLSSPKHINWSAEFHLPDNKGQLSINLKQGIITKSAMNVLIFELRTVGFSGNIKLKEWFDLAHEWIVRGFTDLTTDKMHQFWGRDDNA